jgi:hypothetical protein
MHRKRESQHDVSGCRIARTRLLDGTLDKRLWRGYERTIADTVAYPGFQTWWATRKHWHTDEFCALVDRHIQSAKPTIYDGYN